MQNINIILTSFRGCLARTLKERLIFMKSNIFLSEKNIQLLPLDEKIKYYNNLRESCLEYGARPNKLSSRIMARLCPIMRSYDYEIIGLENIPDDNVIFVCNHSNSHDGFTAEEVLYNIGRNISIFVADDCLSLPSKIAFNEMNSTFIDRRDKESSHRALIELSSKILGGADGVIFGEGTWNLHPIIPMHDMKIGSAKVAAITGKVIVPTIFEYVEVPSICEKEKNLYKKCIIQFGEPVKVSPSDNLYKKIDEVKLNMAYIRYCIWEKEHIIKNRISDIDPNVYVNHTYLKKYGAFGFEYNSEEEFKYLYFSDKTKRENEYFIDENGEFKPGFIKKLKK